MMQSTIAKSLDVITRVLNSLAHSSFLPQRAHRHLSDLSHVEGVKTKAVSKDTTASEPFFSYFKIQQDDERFEIEHLQVLVESILPAFANGNVTGRFNILAF